MRKEKTLKLEKKKIDEGQKNLGHWKELKDIKQPKQFFISLETAITTSETIFTAEVTQQKAQILYQGVYQLKVEYPLGQTFLPDHSKMWLQQKHASWNQRGTKGTRHIRFLSFQNHNNSSRNGKDATLFHKKLETTSRRYRYR